MGRLLPCPIRRPDNILSMPVVGDRLPAKQAGFTAGDPRDWVPGTLAVLQRHGAVVLPWTRECDLLLAPYPVPGRETALLVELLEQLPAPYPVVLYERDVPLLPNLLVESGEDEASNDFESPGAGLRAFRSAFRHRGRGGAEALVLLPARRVRQLLRGSFLAEVHPGPGGSLQNRRFLALALDHHRSLLVTATGEKAIPGLSPVERVALVMPHFDDDVIQCGGALAAARASGAEVRVIWMTDGARGVSTVAPEESARIRLAEAHAAMEALGVSDLHFLGAPETRLRRRGPWTRRLAELLAEFEPERIHLPWWADNNADHFETNRVLRKVWRRSWTEIEIAASGFWAPLPGNRVYPLPPAERSLKDKALRCYASQLEEVDYLRAERGLSCWYARDLVGGGYAESFLCLPAEEYWARYRASGTARRLFLNPR